MAVPQVLAHRLARMDATEFQRMGTEKLAAFQEAWGAYKIALRAFNDVTNKLG